MSIFGYKLKYTFGDPQNKKKECRGKQIKKWDTDPIFGIVFLHQNKNKNSPSAQHNLQMYPYAQNVNSGKDGKFSYRSKQKIHQFLETKKVTYSQV